MFHDVVRRGEFCIAVGPCDKSEDMALGFIFDDNGGVSPLRLVERNNVEEK